MYAYKYNCKKYIKCQKNKKMLLERCEANVLLWPLELEQYYTADLRPLH